MSAKAVLRSEVRLALLLEWAQESGEAAKACADNTEGEVLFPVFTGAVLFLAPAGLVGLCLE